MRTHLQVLRIFFIILAVLQFFNILYFGLVLFAVAGGVPSGGGPGASNAPAVAMLIIFGLLFLLEVTVFVLNILAAMNIHRAARHRLCVTACILNLIPFLSCCWVAGVPVGIYGLIILFGTEGRAVFQRVAEGLTLEQALGERKQINRIQRADDATEIEVDGSWDEVKPADPKSAPPKTKKPDDWQ